MSVATGTATELWRMRVLKPTLGRIPHASTIEPADASIGVQPTAVEGPIARGIADLRAALEARVGIVTPIDPRWR